jgi:hypothetical protein
MSENVGASISCDPKGLHGLYRDNFTLPLPSLCHNAVRVEIYRTQNGLTASIPATSKKTASNLTAACGAEAFTCTRSALRKGMYLPPQHAATAGWRKEKIPIPPIIGAADT